MVSGFFDLLNRREEPAVTGEDGLQSERRGAKVKERKGTVEFDLHVRCSSCLFPQIRKCPEALTSRFFLFYLRLWQSLLK